MAVVQWNTDELLRPDLDDDGKPDYATYGILNDDTFFVAVVMAPIRADSKAEILEYGVGNCQPCVNKLPFYMAVESMDYDTVNGLELPWYKVQYAGQKTGYVWAGLLSACGCQTNGDVRFVAGVVRADAAESVPDTDWHIYTLEIRAVRDGAVLKKVSTTVRNTGSIEVASIEPGARGLQGYRALLCLGFGFGACTYPYDEWYVLWDGQRLVPLPVCRSVWDGGVFSNVERYIFPNDGPDEGSAGHHESPDRIYFSIEHEEREDGEDGQGWRENRWTRVRPMRRDGHRFLRPKQMDEPRD